MEEFVILVNEKDQEIGLEEKLSAHQKGLLHRAFSILIFNSKGELLLQQRAAHKYHSPLLWTNTCCSHPRKGESLSEAANRRLMEEMGMSTELKSIFHFIYYAKLENDLIEHELDHVLVGYSDEEPKINSEEVEAYKWQKISDIQDEMKKNPSAFTAWFQLLLNEHADKILKYENF